MGMWKTLRVPHTPTPPATTTDKCQKRRYTNNPLGTKDPSGHFSAASLWEVAIKRGLGRGDFKVDTRLLRRGLLDNGYSELPIISDHVVETESLPPIHKDPFDRVLVAQATVEGITLLTTDSLVSQYPGPIRRV